MIEYDAPAEDAAAANGGNESAATSDDRVSDCVIELPIGIFDLLDLHFRTNMAKACYILHVLDLTVATG